MRFTSLEKLTVLFLIFLMPLTVIAQASRDGFVAGLKSDELKDLQAVRDDWKKQERSSIHGTFETRTVLLSQTILGRLGYGTKFTGVSDETTSAAVKSYQTARQITATGVVDPETFYSLTRDADFANQHLLTLASFAFHWYDDFVSATGAWDRMNDSEKSFESTEIECAKDAGVCIEADATVANIFTLSILGAKHTTFKITKWDEYELTAEDATPSCELDRLVMNRQEKSAIVSSIPTYKDASCEKTLGAPETVTYRLIDGGKLSIDRNAAAAKRWRALFQMSPEARKALDSKD
jgi:hypothetical protein